MATTTNIAWAGSTLNVGIGCERVSEGCDNCYADELVGRYAGQAGWPRTFESGLWKPQKLVDIAKWARQTPRRIFVNSLSDVHWRQWTHEQVTSLYDAMLAEPIHDYLVLTKRPQRMREFLLGSPMHPTGWLADRGLDAVPPWIWLGTSIELDKYAFRADHLRDIPVTVRFISAEPLLGPVPSLNLEGIGWVIAGGESSKFHRYMEMAWAEDLFHATRDAGTAFFFKQISAYRPGQGTDALFGKRIEEYPLEHPAFRQGERVLGVFTDPAEETPVAVRGGGQGALL